MYKSILLPIDLGHESSWNRPLSVSLELVNSYSAALTIMTVMPDFGLPMVSVNFPSNFEKESQASAAEALTKFVADNVPADIDAKTHVATGTIYSEIMKAADSLGCDLIVMSSHRPEMKDYLIGPNAARVMRHATQSVFVVRD